MRRTRCACTAALMRKKHSVNTSGVVAHISRRPRGAPSVWPALSPRRTFASLSSTGAYAGRLVGRFPQSDWRTLHRRARARTWWHGRRLSGNRWRHRRVRRRQAARPGCRRRRRCRPIPARDQDRVGPHASGDHPGARCGGDERAALLRDACGDRRIAACAARARDAAPCCRRRADHPNDRGCFRVCAPERGRPS